MPNYRLHHIKQDHFAGVDDFEADDDVQACRHAGRLNGSGTAELWSGRRKIKVFNPTTAAPQPTGLSEHIIERAFQLARSGEIQSVIGLRARLKREGFTQVEAHLDGKSTRVQLIKLITEAKR